MALAPSRNSIADGVLIRADRCRQLPKDNFQSTPPATLWHSTSTSPPMQSYPAGLLLPSLVPDISIHLVQSLDVDALMRLRECSRLADEYVSVTIGNRLRALLSPTFNSTSGLMRRMNTARAVISGPGAIHVLFPGVVAPGPLQIYIPYDEQEDFLRYLTGHEGFTTAVSSPSARVVGGVAAVAAAAAAEDSEEEHELPPGAAAVTALNKGPTSIELIRSATDSPLYPIAAQWNSALVYYISSRSFCVAYPFLTREHRALLNPLRLAGAQDLAEPLARERDRWNATGWTIDSEWAPWAPGPVCAGVRSNGCAAATRWFGDAGCTFGVIGHARTARSGFATDVTDMDTVVWWRGGVPCGPGCHSDVATLPSGVRECLWELSGKGGRP